MAKRSILTTASTYPRWHGDSSASFVHELNTRLAKDFHVVALAPYASNTRTDEVMDGVLVHRYRYMPFGWEALSYGGGIMPRIMHNWILLLQVPLFLALQLFAISRLVRKHNARVIHAHWLIPQGLVAVLYKKVFSQKTRILATVLGVDIYGLNNPLGTWMKRFVLRNVDSVTALSTALRDEVQKLGYPRAIRICPMGVNTSDFSPDKKRLALRERLNIADEFLLFVGRLVEKKGLEYLIRAMPDVLVQKPKAKLVVLGEGPLREKMEKLCRSMNIESHVLFLGPVPHKSLPEYFATADVFIGPSIQTKHDSEGLGLVFAEAMSCGTPVITTDLPAIRDVVTDKLTGFIVAQRDAAAISERILWVLNHGDVLKEMKANARAYVVQHFDWNAIGVEYCALLRGLIGDAAVS